MSNFTLEVKQSDVRYFKFYLVHLLQQIKKDCKGNPFTLTDYYQENMSIASCDLQAFFLGGFFLGLGYDGTPAGGSFYSNWKRLLSDHLIIVPDPKPPARPDPLRPVVEREWSDDHYIYKVAGFDFLIRFTPTPREIVAVLGIRAGRGAILFIDTSVEVDSLEFWTILDRAKIYRADRDTTSKVDKNYEIYR